MFKEAWEKQRTSVIILGVFLVLVVFVMYKLLFKPSVQFSGGEVQVQVEETTVLSGGLRAPSEVLEESTQEVVVEETTTVPEIVEGYPEDKAKRKEIAKEVAKDIEASFKSIMEYLGSNENNFALDPRYQGEPYIPVGYAVNRYYTKESLAYNVASALNLSTHTGKFVGGEQGGQEVSEDEQKTPRLGEPYSIVAGSYQWELLLSTEKQLIFGVHFNYQVDGWPEKEVWTLVMVGSDREIKDVKVYFKEDTYNKAKEWVKKQR